MIASSHRRAASVARTLVCGLALTAGCLAGCLVSGYAATTAARADEPAHSAELDAMIVRQAKRHGVPESLVRRIVMRESRYNPRARNHSFWGLMQISYPTARSMGFKGSPSDLLNPVVNLQYAVPYLANAFIVAGKREDAAVRLYARGYYEAARSRGLLGALRTADSKPLAGEPNVVLASAQPESESSPFGALFGSSSPVPEQARVSEAAAPTGALPEGKSSGGESADMVLDKRGAAAPPRKWTHDGGVSVVGRGEQGVEQVAAYTRTASAEEPSGRRHARSHKATTFASLELPAVGQAYAATPDAQGSALARTAPQAAITEATSGAGAPDGQQIATGDPAARSPDAADAKPAKKLKPRRRVAKAARSKATRTAAVQKTDDPATEPAPQ